MDKVLFSNVRCFHRKQEADLAPITILVGENSSGKSTFLSLLRIAWDLGLKSPDFNEEPFFLGAYDQIAHYRGGRGGRAKHFEIGYTIAIPKSDLGSHLEVSCLFEEIDAQPSIKQMIYTIGPYSLNFSLQGIEIVTPTRTVPVDISRFLPSSISFKSPGAITLLGGTMGLLALMSFIDFDPADRRFIDELSHTLVRKGPRPYAIAPIRTKPLRTYDPVKDDPSAEGAHVPMLLSRLESGDRKRWTQLQRALSSFGDASGLFKAVTVKRIGRKLSDPFQLQVQISGPAFNVVDVGYGVSQVLPIMVDSISSDPGSVFLLQQPEVHLHPRAQAELGTFFGLLADEQEKHFVIETHSDFLIDRIRSDIRDKRYLGPDQISLLYFERLADNDVKIHRLHLDERGNILDPPSGYRKFFLDEEQRLLFA